MFSYLNLLKNHIDSSIIKRGQKIFLDGGVQKLTNLEISGWKKTQVSDGSYTYNVIVPLTHLLLNRDKWDKTYQVWQDLTRCQCPYYLEAGICRHTLAVASKLDCELQGQIIKEDVTSGGKSFIDLYDQVNSAQSVNNLLNQFDGLLISSYNPRQLTLLSRITSSYYDLIIEDKQQFMDDLGLLVRKYLKEYENEKKIIKIILDTLRVNPEIWWQLWKDLVESISQHNWIYLVKEIFELSSDVGYNQFQAINLSILGQITSGCDQSIKVKIMEDYQAQPSKPEYFQKCYKLAIAIGNQTWLVGHLEQLDPEKLIELICVLPIDNRDQIDLNIKNQLKQWIVFLPTNQKDEILKIVLHWKEAGEVSEHWYETIDYIKSVINQKTKLYKALSLLAH